MSPPKALDDSALGRFQNLNTMSTSEIDPNTLSYDGRSNSSSSASTKTTPTPPETLGSTSEDDIGETPHSAGPTPDDTDDLASTVSGMSDFASVHHDQNETPDLEQLKLSATGPDLEYRYISFSDTYGRAPFSKPHFISTSTFPPFSGPHTAIHIPFGSDFDKYIHIPRTLRATELGLAELAIFWLWSGLRRDEGSNRATVDNGPVISPALLAHHKSGPPAAPYPMTESTFPAFVGPRTCIFNTGFVLNGWVLQIPRYLNDGEMAVASEQLKQIADKISPWSLRVDPSCRLGVKRSEEEERDLVGFMEQQKEDMTLLGDVVGLDFAAQDDEEGASKSIWVRQSKVDMGLETPKKPTMLPTPPTTGEKRAGSQLADSSLHDVHAASPSVQALVTTRTATTRADLARAARNPFRTAAHIRAWSRNVAASSATETPLEREHHPRRSTLTVDDIETNGHSLSRFGSRFPTAAARGSQAGTVVPTISRARQSTASSVRDDQVAHSDNRKVAVAVAEAGSIYGFVSTLSICDAILVTFCSLILCWLIFTEFM